MRYIRRVASISENARFLFNFIRHPIRTGSVVPSSRFLAQRMIEDMGLDGAATVVEVGPGTGALTPHILNCVTSTAHVLAIELNREFAMMLAAKFPRVAVINDSVENIKSHLKTRGRTHADSVLCSLPWTGFPPDLQERLLGTIASSLGEGGRFCTYTYVHGLWVPGARRLRKLLEEHFRIVETSSVVWRNVPPAVVYRCRK